MKGSLFIKIFVVFPLIIFADYILMAALGCATCLFGPGDEFYCGPFCLAGKIILVLSLVLFGYLISSDIRAIFKSGKNGKAAESEEGQ